MKLRSILLVEDNPDYVLLMEEALEEGKAGQEIIVVKDGEAALDFLYRDHPDKDRPTLPFPDLILLDLKLPKINGLEVLAKIKFDKQLKQVPVVVISSSLRKEDIETAYEAGVNSYIAKPVNFDEFVTKVRQIKSYWFDTNILPTAGSSL